MAIEQYEAFLKTFYNSKTNPIKRKVTKAYKMDDMEEDATDKPNKQSMQSKVMFTEDIATDDASPTKKV